MALAYHITITAYGFWLPNDPRGSGSKGVGSWELFEHGGASCLADRSRSVAGRPHDHRQRERARRSLKFPPVTWTGPQALSIACGFRDAAAESNYQLFALAVLPDHVHVIVAADGARTHGRIAGHLKARATQRLRCEHNWPADRPVWAKRDWTRFLATEDEVLSAIRYVVQNPIKAGLQPQRWSFIVPFLME